MNPTVELVNRWAQYEAKHPNCSIEDFCRHVIIEKREANRDELFGGKMIPPTPHTLLMKLMGRTLFFYSFYIDMVKEEIGIKRPEEFYFLNYIGQIEKPRKTDVIYEFMHELSTGLSILDGLKTSGYIKEINDAEDKRSKRLILTSAGEKVLMACYLRFSQAAEILTNDLPKEDIELCIQLLLPVEFKFNQAWRTHKGKTFKEVYEEVTGRPMQPTKQNVLSKKKK